MMIKSSANGESRIIHLGAALLSLTRKTDYALVALADLARRSPKNASARQIAERLGIPLPMLTNILKELTRSGVLSSTRGPSGGYTLARSSDEITLAQVLDAVEGPSRLVLCCEEQTGIQNCDLEKNCQTKAPMRKLHHMLQHFLSQVTLADIVSNSVRVVLHLSGRGKAVGEGYLVSPERKR